MANDIVSIFNNIKEEEAKPTLPTKPKKPVAPKGLYQDYGWVIYYKHSKGIPYYMGKKTPVMGYDDAVKISDYNLALKYQRLLGEQWEVKSFDFGYQNSRWDDSRAYTALHKVNMEIYNKALEEYKAYTEGR